MKDRIAKLLHEGLSREEIYIRLLQEGTLLDDINTAYSLVVEQTQPQQDNGNRVTYLLVSIGAVLVGAGVLSFVASNWEYLDKLSKIILLLSFLLSTYVGAWFVENRLYYNKTADALFLLGNIVFGANIFLIGQIFNVRGNWPDAFILWMLGVLVFVYVKQKSAFYGLFFLVAFAAVIAHPIFILESVLSSRNVVFTSKLLLLISFIVCLFAGITHHHQYLNLKNKNHV